MLLTDSYGIAPGLTTSRETYEAEFRWGSQFQGVFANALIDGNSVDSGNSPTFELRPGLLLGLNITTGKYKPYVATNTDGTEVASAVLIEGLRMLDFSNVATDRFYAVLVGGPVQASKIIGLDLQARQQMDKFIFDDSSGFGSIPGNHWFPWKRQITKTANYTILATDNFTLFDNTGAGAEVDLTLPAIANGYFFGLAARAAQTFKFISNEGSNIVSDTTTRSNVSVAAIGGVIGIFTNPAGTKWQVIDLGNQTISVG